LVASVLLLVLDLGALSVFAIDFAAELSTFFGFAAATGGAFLDGGWATAFLLELDFDAIAFDEAVALEVLGLLGGVSFTTVARLTVCAAGREGGGVAGRN
jgi:hypothetical protein